MQPTLSQSRTEYQQDRRWHSRYAVRGTAMLEAQGKSYAAAPLELSLAGITFKAKQGAPADQILTLRLDVYGFGEIIVAEVRVIRTHGRTATAIFLTPQSSLARCISWLSSYNRGQKIESARDRLNPLLTRSRTTRHEHR